MEVEAVRGTSLRLGLAVVDDHSLTGLLEGHNYHTVEVEEVHYSTAVAVVVLVGSRRHTVIEVADKLRIAEKVVCWIVRCCM